MRKTPDVMDNTYGDKPTNTTENASHLTMKPSLPPKPSSWFIESKASSLGSVVW